MATMATKNNQQAESAWALAKKQILDDITLSDSERTVLTTCTIDEVINEIKTLDQDHANHSKSRKIMNYLEPVLQGLEKYGKAMDVLSQADPQGIVTLTWGSVRLLLEVAKGFNQYFDDLIDFLRDVARPMARLEAYSVLVPQSNRLQEAVRNVFVDFLKFMMKTRSMFLDKTNKKVSWIKSPGATVFRKNVWKNFGETVAVQIKHINKLCDDAEHEASLAVSQSTVEGQTRQESKADTAYLKADGAYDRQDEAHKNIIAVQKIQVDNARAESHLSHVERGRSEKERQAQSREREAQSRERLRAEEEAKRAQAERDKQELEREAQAKARADAIAERERIAKKDEEDRKASEEALMKEIVEWLNPVDALEDFRQLRGQRMNGTCDWILRKPTFKSWLDLPVDNSKAQRLWVNAIPGAGKTFLCTRVVEYLQEQNKSVAVFYCDTKDDKKRKVENVLRSWAYQLLLHSPGKLRNVATLYRSGKQSNIGLFSEAVRAFLDEDSTRFLVLDALDECELPVRMEFLKILAEFKGAKVLITSRGEDDILRAMKKAGSDVMTIKVESTDNARDIQHYLVEKIEGLQTEDKELDFRIAEELFDAADGMFLYARLMIDQLSQLHTPEDIENALDGLPKDLDTIYSRILSRIDDFPIESNKKNAQLLLKWICAAVEPLTLDEVRNITAFNLDSDEDMLNPRKRLMSTEAFIKKCCGPLVDVGVYDHKIRISHASVKDYLLSQGRTGGASYSVDLDSAHNVIARSCLAYLSYTNIDVVDVDGDHDRALTKLKDHVDSLPMLRYSTLHWWRHALYCANPMGAHIQRAFRKFATNSRHGVKWLQLYQYLRGDRSGQWHPGTNSHVQLLYRLMELNQAWKKVCDEPTWFDELDDEKKYLRFHCLLTSYAMDYYPAITIAALFNYPDFVDSELARGVNVNTTNWCGESPIMLAARGNSVDAMAVLIKHGADASHIGDQTENALHRAISWYGLTDPLITSHIAYDTIPLLLQAGADIHLRNFAGDTVLHYICRVDYELPGILQVLQWVLDAGGHEDLELRNHTGQTPLAMTGWRGHKGCTQILLDAGADPNAGMPAGAKHWGVPLIEAAKKDDITIGLMLIDAGAVVNVADPERHYTPLIEAVIRGSRLVEALLTAGADPNVRDKEGLYPIHHAAIEDSYKSIPLLLQHGADLHVTTSDGKTALDLAVQYGRNEAVKVLTESGAIKSIADAPQETSVDTVAVVYPQTERDTLQTYFLLKKGTRGQVHHSRLVEIMNAAEYWIKTTVEREDPHIITQDDRDDNDEFLPYIISIPITGAELYPVQRVVISTLSHDQGFSSYPQHKKSYNESWTGFRLRVRRTPKSAENWRKYLEQRGTEEKHIKQAMKREEHKVQVNRHGYFEPKLHINTWERHGSHDDLIKSLRKGDILEVVPWAMYQAWQNHILAAKLEIYTAYLTLG